MDLLRVSIVHLTTEGFYIEGFEHKKFCTMRLSLLYRESDFCKEEQSTKSVYDRDKNIIVKWLRHHIMCRVDFDTNTDIAFWKSKLQSKKFIHTLIYYNIWYLENSS